MRTRIWPSILAVVTLQALAQDKVVQLKDDPYRRVVLENAIVRVWEVRVPVGESTPFHEHRNDQVSVRINTTVLTNEPKGGLFSFTRDFALEAGTVSFAEYTGNPYVHKITPKGPSAHHVIEAEILAPATSDHRGITASERPGVTTLLDNRRIRVARVVLEPGRSLDVAPHPNTMVVVVTGGKYGSKQLKAGDVQWHGEPMSRNVKNEGPTPIELVEVAVK